MKKNSSTWQILGAMAVQMLIMGVAYIPVDDNEMVLDDLLRVLISPPIVKELINRNFTQKDSLRRLLEQGNKHFSPQFQDTEEYEKVLDGLYRISQSPFLAKTFGTDES